MIPMRVPRTSHVYSSSALYQMIYFFTYVYINCLQMFLDAYLLGYYIL